MSDGASKAQSIEDHRISFVSLGLLVLDELRFPSKRTFSDVPSGSGIYG